jgi:hypothetical protein
VPRPKAGGGGDGGGGAGGDGTRADAVLIFLPGFKEIQTLHELILTTREFASEPQVGRDRG